MLLAGSLGSTALAQPAAPAAAASAPAAQQAPVAGTLSTVTVRDSAVGDGSTNSKAQLRATRTEIGKGNQAPRHIPQSVTVMTEKPLQDRNLDDFREVLRTTAGVTFLAG